MIMGRWRCATRIAVAVIGLGFAASGWAWPDRPLTLVVGYAAGGATDALARLTAQKLSEILGKPVVVENRAGANGNIAAAFVARAPADGYTLLFGGSNHVTNSYLYQKLPFDFQRDFVPVAMLASLPNVLVVHPSVPANSVGELIALAKAKPGVLNFGSSSVGSSQHLAAELFMHTANVRFTHIPYKGSAPAVADLLAGSIQLMFDNAPSALPNVKAGKIRALGVTSATRSAAAPQIPTIAESGLKDFQIAAWLGIFAPTNTPVDIAQRINNAVAQMLSQPDVVQRLSSQSFDAMSGDLRQIGNFLIKEDARWAQIVKISGAKLD